MSKLTKLKKKYKKRFARGQGITEYGAMIAFVAILVALVFSVTHGKLDCALSAAFSSTASQLNNLSSASASASS
jgi:Flp pilus assembly pilin Flp